MTVSFFGHRDAYNIDKEKLFMLLCELVENERACSFYVGDSGQFDKAVANVLARLKQKYPHIDYAIVLAYLPHSAEYKERTESHPTLFPESASRALPRFAINARNLWMIENSDTVITYVTRGLGGAARFKQIAERKRKRIIDFSII